MITQQKKSFISQNAVCPECALRYIRSGKISECEHSNPAYRLCKLEQGGKEILFCMKTESNSNPGTIQSLENLGIEIVF